MAKSLIIRGHLIEAPIESIIQKLQSELTNGKLRSYKRVGDHVMTQCPEHSGGREAHASFGIYCGNDPKKEYGLCNCFACGFSGNLQTFVASCFDTTIDKGEDWLIKHFGNTLVYEGYNLPTLELNPQKRKIKCLNESDLDTLQSYHPYMTQRHLTQEVCNKFKIKYDPLKQCLVFPVWDEKGNYIFNTSRSVEFKFFNIPKDAEKPVYLLNYVVKENIGYTIVCESQINALYCHSLGLSAVATFGCKVTEKQVNLLIKSGIRHFIIAFDGDKAGEEGSEELMLKLKKYAFVDKLVLPKGKDINDLTKDEIISLIENSGNSFEVLHTMYLGKDME